MEQLSFNLNQELEDIYCEFEDEYQEQIVSFKMQTDLMRGVISYNQKKNNLKEWFLKRFFSYDLEISCEDLYNIAVKNGVKLI